MKHQSVFFSVGFVLFGLLLHLAPFSTGEEPLAYRVYEGHVVFYDGASESFYFVQYEKEMSFPEVLYLVEYDEAQGILQLRDSSGKVFVFDPNASANYYGLYAVGHFGGKKYRKLVTKKHGVYALSDALQDLPCSCQEKAEVSTCRSGGKGAVGCALSKGLWGKKKNCRVRCGGEGHFACCNN